MDPNIIITHDGFAKTEKEICIGKATMSFAATSEASFVEIGQVEDLRYSTITEEPLL
jgi:hypothetical protein